MKDKFFKFINLQGKYLTSLLIVLLFGIGQMRAADVTLFSTDFSSSDWSGKTFSQGNTTTPDVHNGITFYSKASDKQFSIGSGELSFPNNNISSSNYFLAIPITGVNGSITVTLTNTVSSSSNWNVKYVVKQETSVSTPGGTGTASSSAKTTTTFTVSSLTKSDYVVYIGRSSSSDQYKKIKTITITTPAPSCDAPTTAFADGAYTVGGSSLALSSLISNNNSDGAISYTVKTDGGTSASISEGSFSASAAGTATITATQAADATNGKCEKIIDFDVVVSAAPVANPEITFAVSPEGYGTVSESSITVDNGDEVSISSSTFSCNDIDVTATPTAATAEYTYVFESWSGASNGDEVTTDITVTANFTRTANSYAVNYTAPSNGSYTIKVGDASAVSTNTTAAYSSTVTLSATPAEGYKFTGWTVAKAVGTVEVSNNQFTMPAEAVTVTATFEQACYTVLYDLVEGVGSEAIAAGTAGTDVAITAGELLSLKNTAGKIRLTPASGSFKNGDVITFKGTIGNTSKKYGLKVRNASDDNELCTLQVNGASGELTVSGTLTLPSDQASIIIQRADGSTTNLTSCVIKRQIDCPAPAVDYTVTINPNGGAYAETPDGWTYDDVNGVYTKSIAGGTSFNAPDGLTKSTDELSWKDGSDDDVTFPVTISSDITFVAQWTPYVESSNADLSALSVAGCTLNESFSASTTAYTIDLPLGSSMPAVGDVTATKADTKAKTPAVSISGNVITIACEAEDGTKKNYTITVTIAATKDILLVHKTGSTACPSGSTSTQILSNNAAVSTYINQITFTNVEGSGDNGAEGGSLNVGKKAGNMFTLTAKAGYALKTMNFNAKIQDATCEFSLDGGEWQTLTSTNTSGDECYNDIFGADEEVHEFRLRSTGASGVWIRNMQLTMIQACTAKTIAWTTAPASEYEVGATGLAIAASANNGTVAYAASNAAITVNASTGALTINSLTNDIDLSASVTGGDGTVYCTEGASVVKEEIKTYYLVTFNPQNETAATPVKYYDGDAAIALPSAPDYPGYNFLGWFDASTSGNKITEAITPTASRTVYAQWEEQCAGPTITTQPASANYFVDRTATALNCVATPGVTGKALTYTWYSCDDAERTNPVALAGAPTPSTAAVGTFYYYCAVTEADCDVIRNSNVVTITVTEKDKACIIKATLKGGTTTPDVEGYLAGSATANTQNYSSTYDGYKFGSNGHYVGLTLADGEEFKTGDVVNIYVGGVEGGAPASKVYFATAASADDVVATIEQNLNQGNNYINLPDELNGAQTFYLYRKDSKMNPYMKYAEVYRPYPVPVLTAMTVNGSDATISGTNVTATIASNAELASLTIVPTFMSNKPSETNGALGGPWVENEGIYTNSYVVTDKDGDSNTYTITLTRDVEIASVTISGETSVAAESQITLTATVLPNNVINKAVTWSSSDETKAVVDANGVVTGKAAGSVTITATAVADNTKKGTYDITVTPFVGTKYAYWFTKTADIPEDLANDDGTIFEGAPSSGSNTNASMTVEINGVDREFNVTGRSGDVSFGTFHVPAGFTADLYVLAVGSGSPRTLKLQETTTSAVYKSTPEEFGNSPVKLVYNAIPAGNYTFDKGDQNSRVFMMVAALNSYPLTSITLSDMSIRTGNTGKPAMTLVNEKAAITSQTWSIVENNATGTIINASTGVITAGTTAGTVTVKVVAEDAMGNEVTSNTCTVTIVEIYERVDVTGDITWNWNAAGNTENVSVATASGLALANYISGADWQKINGTDGDFAYNTNASGSYQGTGKLAFHTTVPGIVKVTARRISNDANIMLGDRVIGLLTSSVQTFPAMYVPAGEVEIIADATKGMRVTKIEFIAKAAPDYTRNVSNNIGTLCVDHNVVVGGAQGATFYQIASRNELYDFKIDFEEVLPGEELKAGEPYIFQSTTGRIDLYYGATVADAPVAVRGMIGSFANTTLDITEENKSNILYIASNKLWNCEDLVGGHLEVVENRAYIDMSQVPTYAEYTSAPQQSNPAPRRRVTLGRNGENTATGMDQITNEQSQMTNKVIIDGQLFIIRGEKMYDVTGKLVK